MPGPSRNRFAGRSRGADDAGAIDHDPPTRRTSRPPSESDVLPNASPRSPQAPDADRYAILELLGAGAMGAVHLCEDRRIGRDVAMKIVRPEHAADGAARLRFEREARVQGQLEHPAIVPVHDLGVAPDGSVFFTMKRVQGESLHAILNGLRRKDGDIVERYGRRRLLSAFGTVCLAVAFAHSRGVVHRDIKPGNIMFGDFGEVYLLDWGVARVRRPGDLPLDATWEAPALQVPDAFASLTSVGELLGTVGYMAPEQVRGEEIDERADIYALGSTLFELLTLLPLHPRTAVASIQSTIRGADARASVRAPGAHVARELEALCVRATALDPAARPASAREFYDVIERVLDGDRDVERRRMLAADHAARGRTDARRAIQGGPGAREARERAVHEVNRAVVLDPHNEEAIATLTELARVPAADSATEAENDLREATRGVRRLLARMGAALFFPWLAAIGIVSLLGVRSQGALALAALAVVCGSALAWARSRVDDIRITLATLVVADLAAALSAAAFGPFLVVPGLLACTGVAFTIASTAERSTNREGISARYVRHGAWIMSVVSFVTPVVLEWTGVVPPSIAFRDGTIVLLPRAVAFSSRFTLPMLVAINAALIVVPALIAARVRDYAARVELRAFESASHLLQLLPREAQAAVHARRAAPDDA